MVVGCIHHERDFDDLILVETEIHRSGLILWERTTPVPVEVNGIQ